MGSCINKSNDIINIRINERSEHSDYRNEKLPINSKSKKYVSTAVSSLEFNTNKYDKINPYPSLYSNDISKILILPEIINYENNKLNSIIEIVELFDQ